MPKLHFRKPRASPAVVFEHSNPVFFRALGLRKDLPVILYPNQELCLHPSVIFGSLLIWIRNVGFKKTHLINCYLSGYLRAIDCNLALTFIDDNPHFYAVSLLSPGVQFISVANGMRFHSAEAFVTPGRPINGKAKYFLFSEEEAKVYRKLGIKVSELLPSGSVLASYFASNPHSQLTRETFDVCLVSQWRRSFMLEGNESAFLKGVRVGLDRISSELKVVIKKQNLRLVIAGASLGDEAEKAYFEKYFPKAQFYFRGSTAFSTYELMNQSSLVVGLFSSALYEALVLHKKVIFCNYLEYQGCNFPETAEFLVEKGSNFASVFEKIWNMSCAEYFSNSRLSQIMNLRRDSHRVVRRAIQDSVGHQIFVQDLARSEIDL
jgi:surface carbohydrate biosynthesis protein